MHKVKLDVDELRVESFESTTGTELRGTVDALELRATISCGSLCERSECISGPCC